MIEINNLVKTYNKNTVLNHVNVRFDDHKTIAVLGPNGSGKTTLLKCILGLVLPDEGSITIDETNIRGQFEYRNKIGYLSQVATLPDNLTGREYLQLMESLKNTPSNQERFIQMFGLEEHLDKKMSNLSGGNKQKINITASLMHENQIIILDEPSTGLDPLSLRRFRNYLLEEKKMGKLILITTHILNFADDLSDDVLFILDGEVYYYGSRTALLEENKEPNLEGAIATILSKQKEKWA